MLVGGIDLSHQYIATISYNLLSGIGSKTVFDIRLGRLMGMNQDTISTIAESQKPTNSTKDGKDIADLTRPLKTWVVRREHNTILGFWGSKRDNLIIGAAHRLLLGVLVRSPQHELLRKRRQVKQ
jgi:hypothetical protein